MKAKNEAVKPYSYLNRYAGRFVRAGLNSD